MKLRVQSIKRVKNRRTASYLTGPSWTTLKVPNKKCQVWPGFNQNEGAKCTRLYLYYLKEGFFHSTGQFNNNKQFNSHVLYPLGLRGLCSYRGVAWFAEKVISTPSSAFPVLHSWNMTHCAAAAGVTAALMSLTQEHRLSLPSWWCQWTPVTWLVLSRVGRTTRWHNRAPAKNCFPHLPGWVHYLKCFKS